MTGEGIGQALQSGVLAAQAVIAGSPHDPAGVRSRYTTAMGRHLVADHRMSLRLGRVLAHARSAEMAVRIAGSTSWTRRNFARWLFEDYPRAVLVTPRRWRRGMFAKPGAY